MARSTAASRSTALVAWGLKRGNVRFAILGDHANSRGAADMGLLPDLLPGYVPVTAPGAFPEYPGLPATPGKTLPQIFGRGRQGRTGRVAGRGRQSGAQAALDRRSFEGHIRHGAGHVPYRDRGAGRRGASLPPAFTKKPAR